METQCLASAPDVNAVISAPEEPHLLQRHHTGLEDVGHEDRPDGGAVKKGLCRLSPGRDVGDSVMLCIVHSGQA